MIQIGKPAKFFSWKELCHSNTAVYKGIDNQPEDTVVFANLLLLGTVMDSIREEHGPYVPNSCFRSLELNRYIGSSDRSKHIQGRAVDITHSKIGVWELAQWIRNENNPLVSKILVEEFPRIDYLSQWVHVEIDIARNNKPIRCFHIHSSGTTSYMDTPFCTK